MKKMTAKTATLEKLEQATTKLVRLTRRSARLDSMSVIRAVETSAVDAIVPEVICLWKMCPAGNGGAEARRAALDAIESFLSRTIKDVPSCRSAANGALRLVRHLRLLIENLHLWLTPDGLPPGLNIGEWLDKFFAECQRIADTAMDKVNRPRADKKVVHGWKRQEDVAKEFSLAAKKIQGKYYGKVTIARVKDWESRYPDEKKREPKSGYYAGLRNTPNPTDETKRAYIEAAKAWNEYWTMHNGAFCEWLKRNPGGTHADFLTAWERPGKRVHMSDTDKTKRYSCDNSFAEALDSGALDSEEALDSDDT